MKIDRDLNHRSPRLSGYDYTQSGAYFITICTYHRQCLFGEIIDGEMRFNEHGQTARDEWFQTAALRLNIVLDEFSIMPNHFHCILIIRNNDVKNLVRRDTACCVLSEPIVNRFGHTANNSIPSVIRAFKSAVTKRINETRHTPGVPVWQKNYYEHIIRGEEDLNVIRQYIQNNPTKWAEDGDNPANSGHI